MHFAEEHIMSLIRLFGFLCLLAALTACSGGAGSAGSSEDPGQGTQWDQMKWDQGKWG
jgi:hypothetical protein